MLGLGIPVCLAAIGAGLWKWKKSKDEPGIRSLERIPSATNMASMELGTLSRSTIAFLIVPMRSSVDLSRVSADAYQPVSTGVNQEPDFISQISGHRFKLLPNITPTIAKEIEAKTGRTITSGPGEEIKKGPIAKGKFGEVYAARNLSLKDIVAVKKVTGKDKIEASLREGQIQGKLEHRNVLKLLDYLHYVPPLEKQQNEGAEEVLYQVMPLAIGDGTLFQEKLALVHDPKVKQHLFLHVTEGLLKGFEYLHGIGRYHGDFKPGNFLIMKGFIPQISDFGCTIISDTDQVSGGSGDTGYFSPRRLDNSRYLMHTKHREKAGSYSASKSDMWAFGLSLLETWTNTYPFDRGQHMKKEIRFSTWDRAYFRAKLGMTPDLRNPKQGTPMALIKGLLALEDDERPQAKHVLRNPLFQSKGSEHEYQHQFRHLLTLKPEHPNGASNSSSHGASMGSIYTTSPEYEAQNYQRADVYANGPEHTEEGNSANGSAPSTDTYSNHPAIIPEEDPTYFNSTESAESTEAGHLSNSEPHPGIYVTFSDLATENGSPSKGHGHH